MNYYKDFDGWNSAKKDINNNFSNFFQEKDIWWCSMGINIGREQDGKGSLYKRPVYILKKIDHRTFIGLPLTSRLREDRSHVTFYFNFTITTALISQIRTFDARRFVGKIGVTSDYLHEKIKKTTVAFLLSWSSLCCDTGPAVPQAYRCRMMFSHRRYRK